MDDREYSKKLFWEWEILEIAQLSSSGEGAGTNCHCNDCVFYIVLKIIFPLRKEQLQNPEVGTVMLYPEVSNTL